MSSFITLTQATTEAPSIYIRIAAIDYFTAVGDQTLISFGDKVTVQVTQDPPTVLAAIEVAEAAS